jgi:hypothetical protein
MIGQRFQLNLYHLLFPSIYKYKIHTMVNIKLKNDDNLKQTYI